MKRSTAEADARHIHPDGPSGGGLSAWFDTPPGRYLLEWERAHFDAAVVDRFGYHALQVGLPELDALQANRMPHRWLSLPEWREPVVGSVAAEGAPRVALVSHAAALPFPANSIDLVLLPHTLEFSADPHAVLREVERVLVPEGHLVVSGFNPHSLWGLRQRRVHWLGHLRRSGMDRRHLFLPESGEFISQGRVRDWLRLLGLELESAQFGCYRPAVRTDQWLRRFAWMDALGARAWPIFGAVYFLTAVKRVHGMHLLGPAWRPRRASTVPATVMQKPSLRCAVDAQEEHSV